MIFVSYRYSLPAQISGKPSHERLNSLTLVMYHGDFDLVQSP